MLLWARFSIEYQINKQTNRRGIGGEALVCSTDTQITGRMRIERSTLASEPTEAMHSHIYLQHFNKTILHKSLSKALRTSGSHQQFIEHKTAASDLITRGRGSTLLFYFPSFLFFLFFLGFSFLLSPSLSLSPFFKNNFYLSSALRELSETHQH